MSKRILGISGFYHDSAAALLVDGKPVAAAQEERFTRIKHDAAFPAEAIRYCLREAQCTLKDIDYIVFYDKPLLKFERLLETYFSYAPKGLSSFICAIPVWLKEKLFLKSLLRKELAKLGEMGRKDLPPLLFTEHHQSHAASAFFPSPFERAAVICLDGVGEWATTSVWLGDANQLKPQWQINFPHSLGLLYSAFTYFTGFKVNSGEYKLMGLAPYGQPKYVDLIKENLIDIKPDGTFRLNMQYFNYATGLTMTNKKFAELFGRPPRARESQVTQDEMDIARSIQVVTEEIVLRLVRSVQEELQVSNVCLAGGVALNCVANGKLLEHDICKNLWIQPAAGDAGGALGAAYSVWYEFLQNKRWSDGMDAMQGAYLGPSFSNAEITTYLDTINAKYQQFDDTKLLPQVAELLAQDKVIGWFQGRMEFGPRALGGRSIIGDARSPNMQSVMNLKIKYRESFRPFAPAIKFDKVSEWFELSQASPYMLLVAGIAKDKRKPVASEDAVGLELLKQVRSEIPAVTHVDCSARVQTVYAETNPRFYQLLDNFEQKTGCPVVINTSFNVRGEPIVCTPEDAYRCFMRTEMDYLVLENVLLSKTEQPQWEDNKSWQQEFELD